MSSLVYLLRTEFKNSMKELLRKPGKLVLYLLMTALIVGLLLSSLFIRPDIGDALPLDWLVGIYFAFTSLFLIMAVQKGLTSGDAIFEMSDVNLLFVSPLDSRSILLYGVLRLAKTSFWAGFFILFQGNSLANFGVTPSGILILFAVFILTVVMLTILSLIIYSTTNGNPRRQRIVKVLTVAIYLPFALYLGSGFLTATDGIAFVLQALSSPLLHGIPFTGWASAGAVALLEGNILIGILWLGLLLAAGGGMLAFMLCSRADYYEDVLVATETAFEKKRAIAEGDLQAAAAMKNATVKVTTTGISGAGASTLFYKHLRESFRQHRFGFFGVGTVVTAISVIGASLLMPDWISLPTLLQFLMWFQVFLIGNGRGLRELYSHYIYLIPASPLQKMIWSNLELVFKTLIESVLYFGVTGLILRENPLIILGAIATYTLFSLFLLGINYLFMRVTEANVSQGLLVVLYLIAVILLLLPGLIPAFIVGFAIGGTAGLGFGLLILSGWELIASLLCFALSKGMLHNCDMPTMKPSGK